MASIKAKLCDVDEVEISVNFVCVITAAADDKINKIVDGKFPR